MKAALRYAKAAGRRLADTVRNRKIYRGWTDVGRVAGLRVSSSVLARRLFPGAERIRSFHIRDSSDPIHVRAANSDFLVWSEIFEKAEYLPVLKMGLPAGATILDLGANIGLAARYFDIHFPACRVVSVEPDARNCQIMAMNCQHLISNGRLDVVQAFVAADDGQASLDRDGDSWEFRKVEPVGSERISCYSIPTLCREHGIDAIDLFKCDVEGTEAELFAHCSDWIKRVRNMVIEVHRPYGLGDLYKSLNDAGWDHRVLYEVPHRLAFLSAAS